MTPALLFSAPIIDPVPTPSTAPKPATTSGKTHNHEGHEVRLEY